VSQQASVEDDPYVCPGTSILRNLPDIRDEESLERFDENPVAVRFDSDHLKYHLFQDVFAWAGEFRTVNMARGNSFFARPEYIVPELQKVLDRLASEHLLPGADSQGFCERAAYFFGEMNAGVCDPPEQDHWSPG